MCVKPDFDIKRSICAQVFAAATLCCPSPADNCYCSAGLVLYPGSLTGAVCDPLAVRTQAFLSICFALHKPWSWVALVPDFPILLLIWWRLLLKKYHWKYGEPRIRHHLPSSQPLTPWLSPALPIKTCRNWHLHLTPPRRHGWTKWNMHSVLWHLYVTVQKQTCTYCRPKKWNPTQSLNFWSL